MTKNSGPLQDSELDRLLNAASQPPELSGFEQRLKQRIAAGQAAEPMRSNVLPFAKVAKPVPEVAPTGRRFGVAAALAASLMLGLLVGTTESVSSYIESYADSGTLGQLAEFAPAGLDELGKLDGENQS